MRDLDRPRPHDPARVSRALVAFSRPHTIVGTVVAVLALFVVARALPTRVEPGALELATALAAGLAVNVYIVGLNQLTDVELDRINKPRLPLPAGLLSVPVARWLVGGSLAVSLLIGAIGGRWLLAAIIGSALLGTAYSVPPLRFKRHHLLAAACIVVARGLLVNVFVFAHYALPPDAGLALPGAVILLTAVVVALGLVIAWFKDLPDMEGDARHAVGTLPLRLGGRRVVTLGVGTLFAVYALAAMLGARGVSGLDPIVTAIGHVVLAVLLLRSTIDLDLTDPRSVTRFYRTIWLLFYAEYAVVCAAALAG